MNNPCVVVDLLEKNGKGLNLTWEVRDGIVHHSKSRAAILGKGWTRVGTLEGEIVKLADMVAYVNHDSDDAIRAGIIEENGLPESATNILGNSPSARINTMVCDIIKHSWQVSGDGYKYKKYRYWYQYEPPHFESHQHLSGFSV